jgi:Mn-containing catalase
MILRVDRLQTELPPPSDPDPVGAAAVQELLGGKFGEMSTFMNYTYQSFNFRNRQGARPFYDLLASIAAEEFGHIELVSAAINTMLTGAADGTPGKAGALKGVKDTRNTQHFIAGGAGALVQDSMGKPWSGDYVFSSGDLVEDLTHNFFLETGARNNKLKVYEMVDHPAARALTGYLLVRGGVHQVAYARALENLTGAQLMKLFPSPRIPTDKIPECKPHIKRGEHLKLYPLLAGGLPGARGRLQRSAPRDRRGSPGRRRDPARGRAGARPAAADRRLRPGPGARGDRGDRRQAPPGRRPAQGADRHRGRQRQGQEQRLDPEPDQEQGGHALSLVSSRGGADDVRLPGPRAAGYPRRP